MFRHIAESVLPYLGVSARIEDETAWRTMHTMRISDTPVETATDSVTGMSMREVRRFAAGHGLRLHVHGSGWVNRQQPVTINGLEQGDLLEVWLGE